MGRKKLPVLTEPEDGKKSLSLKKIMNSTHETPAQRKHRKRKLFTEDEVDDRAPDPKSRTCWETCGMLYSNPMTGIYKCSKYGHIVLDKNKDGRPLRVQRCMKGEIPRFQPSPYLWSATGRPPEAGGTDKSGGEE